MQGDSNQTWDASETADSSPETQAVHVIRRIILLTLLAVSLTAVFLFLYVKHNAKSGRIVERIQLPSADRAGIYAAHIIDARENRNAEALEGRLYRVKVDDVSRDSAAGVARIGGLVTFIPGTRPGQVVVAELLTVKRSTAEARLIHVEQEAPSFVFAGENMRDAQDAHDDPVRDGAASAADDVQPGQRFRVEVSEKDRKNPEHDGVARIGGLVTFVPGTQPGDRVLIRITERARRFAKSVVLESPADGESRGREPGAAGP